MKEAILRGLTHPIVCDEPTIDNRLVELDASKRLFYVGWLDWVPVVPQRTTPVTPSQVGTAHDQVAVCVQT